MDDVYVDLHIHSCLSPCASEDMTPANICAMAALKGLSVIAVTDHNSARNLPYVQKAAHDNGLLLLPGIEITTREEVHLLAYFESVEAALGFGKMLRGHLPVAQNKPALFGTQLVMDERDNILNEETALLIGATDLPLTTLIHQLRDMGGVAVPAHINRGTNGLLVNLGMMPKDVDLPCVEYWRALPCDEAALKNRRSYFSSDAHELGSILEREMMLPLQSLSTRALLRWLSGA